jgi:hypothetical protein
MRKGPKNTSTKHTPAQSLTAKQKRELAAIAALPDDQIDTSDIPELPPSTWKNAVRPVLSTYKTSSFAATGCGRCRMAEETRQGLSDASKPDSDRTNARRHANNAGCGSSKLDRPRFTTLKLGPCPA